jgi:hypothetical protein
MTDEREKNEHDAARYAVAAHVALTLIEAIIAAERGDEALRRIADVVKSTQAVAPRRKRRTTRYQGASQKNEGGNMKEEGGSQTQGGNDGIT